MSYGSDDPTPDGACIRDCIHIVDLAAAHMLALAHETGNVFNLGSGGGQSVRQVVETVWQVHRPQGSLVEKPRSPGGPPKLVGDSTKIRKVLGWKSRFDPLEAITASVWEWPRQHPDGYR